MMGNNQHTVWSHSMLFFYLVLFFFGQPILQLVQNIEEKTIVIVDFDTEGDTKEENKKDQEKIEYEEEKILSQGTHYSIAIQSDQNGKIGLPIQFFLDIAFEITIPPPDYNI